MLGCSTFTPLCDDKVLMFVCWGVLTGFCCRDPIVTGCKELREFPCPESKLEPGCSEFIMFGCAVEAPDKDRELCCRLDIEFCGIVGTEPCKFIDCTTEDSPDFNETEFEQVEVAVAWFSYEAQEAVLAAVQAS